MGPNDSFQDLLTRLSEGEEAAAAEVHVQFADRLIRQAQSKLGRGISAVRLMLKMSCNLYSARFSAERIAQTSNLRM